jgi:hypothetical protein
MTRAPLQLKPIKFATCELCYDYYDKLYSPDINIWFRILIDDGRNGAYYSMSISHAEHRGLYDTPDDLNRKLCSRLARCSVACKVELIAIAIIENNTIADEIARYRCNYIRDAAANINIISWEQIAK